VLFNPASPAAHLRHGASEEREPYDMEEEPEAVRRYDGSREVRSPSRKPGHKGKGKGNSKGKGFPGRAAGGKGTKKSKDKDKPAKKGSPQYWSQQRQQRKEDRAAGRG